MSQNQNQANASAAPARYAQVAASDRAAMAELAKRATTTALPKTVNKPAGK